MISPAIDDDHSRDRGPVAPDPQTKVHPRLVAVFAALDRTGQAWVLLRGFDDLARPCGDVDLLVAPPLLPQLDRVLAEVGMHRVLAGGRGTHRFYFDYDPVADLWLKLDVVSDISFGNLQQWPTALAGPCLRRRTRRHGVPMPAADDQGLLEILHLALDKGRIDLSRADAARSAATRASLDSTLLSDLDHRAGGKVRQLVQAVSADRLAEFPALAQDLMGRLTRSAPFRSRLVALANRIKRISSTTLAGRAGAGVTVAVMGPDGAGKTTLLTGIADSFPVTGAYVYMGLWTASRWDGVLRRLPGGRLGQRLLRLARGGLLARYHRIRGRLVLLDRMAYDTLLPGSVDTSVGGRLTRALALRTAPKVDVLFVLDAPGEIMYARKGEHSVETLETWRETYLRIADRLPEACVLDATRPARRLRAQAVEIVWRLFVDPGAAASVRTAGLGSGPS
ncbi:MAG TPA: hypothetical protein VIT65_12655 [Microlunatus sp.]